MPGKLSEILHGARRIEVFIFVTIVALLCLFMFGNETNSIQTPESVLESRLESILSNIEEVSRPHVMVTQEGHDVVGVVVIADGVSDISSMLKIQSAIKTLLDIEITRIEIIDRG